MGTSILWAAPVEQSQYSARMPCTLHRTNAKMLIQTCVMLLNSRPFTLVPMIHSRENSLLYNPNHTHRTANWSLTLYFQASHRLPSDDPDSAGSPASFLMASLLALTSSANFSDSATEACFARSFSASAWTVHTMPSLAPHPSQESRGIVRYSLGLSDLEYSLSLVTKSSNSCCRSTRRSRLRVWSSGLYFWKSSSSVGCTHLVRAGPPTQMAPPLFPISEEFNPSG